MFQSRSGRTINLNFGLLVNRHCRDQVQFGEGQIALRSHRLISGSGTKRLLLLCDIKCPLGQIAGLAGRLYAGDRLFKRILGVADFDPDLLSQFFAPELCLPVFEFGAVLIGLCDPIADWNIQVEADVVVRGSVV